MDRSLVALIVDHVLAEHHQRETRDDNLCLACFACNRHKSRQQNLPAPMKAAILNHVAAHQHEDDCSRGWCSSAERRFHLAAQRITIAKVGGIAADVTLLRLREWAGARQSAEPDEWSNDQWPSSVRVQVDAFADRLRASSLLPPVVYFVEWSDLWSMGDLFSRWLTPPGGPPPFVIHANRFEVYGYALPDGGRLGRHLATAGPQQFDEHDWFVARLHEALKAWQQLTDQAALIVIREVVGGLHTDDDLLASLSCVPEWFVEEAG